VFTVERWSSWTASRFNVAIHDILPPAGEQPNDMRIELTKPDLGKEKNRSIPRVTTWFKYGITLLLLLAAVVTGIAVYEVRQEWWDLYLGLKR
jgi:hypothetical protein